MAADGNQNPDEIRARAFKTTTADNIVKYPKADERKPLLTLHHAKDAKIDRSCSEYLLKGIIDRGTLGAIYGPPGFGKTFTALALGRSIAAGVPFLGMKTRKSPVLYLGLEGSAKNIEKRIKIASEGYHAGDPFFWARISGTDFNNSEFFPALLEKMKEEGIQFIILDTLKKLIGQRDENGPGMAYAEEVAEGLIRATDAALGFVAHTPKGTDWRERGIRGHSGIQGTLDWGMLADKGESGHSLTLEKVKDGEDKIRFSYRLERVDCGADDEGDPITTCRAVDFERADAAPKATPSQRMSKTAQNEALLLEAIHDLFATAEHVELAGINHGPPVRTIERRFVVDRAIRMGFFTDKQLTEDAQEQLRSGLSNFLSGPSPLADRGGTLFSDTLKSLKTQGKIYADRERIALPNEDRT